MDDLEGIHTNYNHGLASSYYQCIINSFFNTIPNTTLLTSLSIIDDIILKINDNDIENIFHNINDSRENILYVLSFEKLIKDNNGELISRD